MIFGMYDDLKKIYKNICLSFNKKPDKETFELWYENLKDYDIWYLEKAYKQIIAEDKYFPTISRFYEIIKNLPNHVYTEEEKIERWEFKPSWYGKDITKEEMTTEELNEMENLMKEFKD